MTEANGPSDTVLTLDVSSIAGEVPAPEMAAVSNAGGLEIITGLTHDYP